MNNSRQAISSEALYELTERDYEENQSLVPLAAWAARSRSLQMHRARPRYTSACFLSLQPLVTFQSAIAWLTASYSLEQTEHAREWRNEEKRRWKGEGYTIVSHALFKRFSPTKTKWKQHRQNGKRGGVNTVWTNLSPVFLTGKLDRYLLVSDSFFF